MKITILGESSKVYAFGRLWKKVYMRLIFKTEMLSISQRLNYMRKYCLVSNMEEMSIAMHWLF